MTCNYPDPLPVRGDLRADDGSPWMLRARRYLDGIEVRSELIDAEHEATAQRLVRWIVYYREAGRVTVAASFTWRPSSSAFDAR